MYISQWEKNIRSLKSTGSNKIGKACPSRMEVVTTKDEKGFIKVEFYKNHYGHDLGLGHIMLSKEARAEIAGIYNLTFLVSSTMFLILFTGKLIIII